MDKKEAYEKVNSPLIIHSKISSFEVSLKKEWYGLHAHGVDAYELHLTQTLTHKLMVCTMGVDV